jgi:hypothetical protein
MHFGVLEGVELDVTTPLAFNALRARNATRLR